ncbi:hypothetical protein C2S51_024966 [Perilla frutescens var. frutescens]|nr:hypothetical protein C2S51_024966 [Perilla frutescens var. frutescens]
MLICWRWEKKLSQQLSKQDFELWAVTVYSTWTFLCQVKHQPDSLHKEVCVEGVAAYLQSFKEARHALRVESSPGVKLGGKRWYPPENGVFRLDVDAAVNINTHLSGVGAVVRDCKGKIRAALAKSTLWPSSIVKAEINAVLYGVGLCL